MRANGDREASALHPVSTFLPPALLLATPLFDIVRLVTHAPMWGRVALWSALLGVVVVGAALGVEVVDWVAADRHTRARSAGAAPLTVHLAALCPLALGVFERLHLTTVARAAMTRLDAWPMALSIAGALAWLVGAWMAEERVEERVRYQPIGLPFKA